MIADHWTIPATDKSNYLHVSYRAILFTFPFLLQAIERFLLPTNQKYLVAIYTFHLDDTHFSCRLLNVSCCRQISDEAISDLVRVLPQLSIINTRIWYWQRHQICTFPSPTLEFGIDSDTKCCTFPPSTLGGFVENQKPIQRLAMSVVFPTIDHLTRS